jgi:hypothetical protein
MKYSLPIFTICSMLTLSCRASDTSSISKDATSCPAEINKGVKVPVGAKLIGEFPESKRKLRSVGLIKKSTSHFDEQLDEWVWDEEIVEWEDDPEGSSANTEFDSTQTDWMLMCSYPGGIDPKKKKYFSIDLLLPIQEHVPISCRFSKTKGTTSATCKIKGSPPKPQLNPSSNGK